jgi:antirestriction protein ArdC
MQNKPRINHGGDRAFYAPLYDKVQLPIPEAFKKPEEYYSTAFHELVHSTGHQSRLNRKKIVETNNFGSHDYSKEELVAELGSAFLCAECDIVDRVIDNSTAYVSGWMEKLEKNPKWIILASAKAEKAYSYIARKNNDSKY